MSLVSKIFLLADLGFPRNAIKCSLLLTQSRHSYSCSFCTFLFFKLFLIAKSDLQRRNDRNLPSTCLLPTWPRVGKQLKSAQYLGSWHSHGRYMSLLIVALSWPSDGGSSIWEVNQWMLDLFLLLFLS